MRRAVPVLAAMFAASLALPVHPARADCSKDAATMRAKLGAVREPAKRQEIELLLAKAQRDDSAGRADLCAAALQHAAQLTK